MSKNKGFSRVMALVLLICMVVSFAPAAYADVDETQTVQEEALVKADASVDAIVSDDTYASAVPHKLIFNGNGAKLTTAVAGSYTSKTKYTAGTEVSLSKAMDGKKFAMALSSDYSTNYRQTGWNTAKDGSGEHYAMTATFTMPDADTTLYAEWESYEWLYWLATVGEGGESITLTEGVTAGVKKTGTSFKLYTGNTGNQYGKVPAAYYTPVTATAKEGYTFVGWYDVAKEALVTASASLYVQDFRNLRALKFAESGSVLEARFEKQPTITYTDGVDGEEIFPDQVYYANIGDATPAFQGETPTRTNYTFTGWQPEVAETVTGDATYVAQWEPTTLNKPKTKVTATNYVNKMSIMAFAEGTSEISSSDFFCQPTIKAKGVSFKIGDIYGNDADGYFTDVTFTFKSGDKFETAARNVFNTDRHYTAINGHERWTGDWSYNFTEEHPATQVVTLKWIPTSNGKGSWQVPSKYSSTGYTSNMGATSSILQVKLKLERTVTYTDGVKGGAFADQVYTIRNGETAPAFNGTPTREGYKFVGWEPAVDATAKLYADTTYTAQWVKTYTVTYTDGADGEAFASESYEVVENDATPAFSGSTDRPGWDFTGWEPEVAETVTADVTYTAQWKIRPANALEYDANGGEGAPERHTTDGVAITVSTTVPTYAGFDFIGWNTQANGKGDSYEAEDLILFTAPHNGEVVTLYAQWKARPANAIYYDANGGVGGPSNNFSNAIYATVQSSKPTRDGYTFTGWNTAADGSGDSYKGGDKYYFTAIHNGESITLYAQWIANDYTLTRDSNGGDKLDDVTVTVDKTYGDAIVASPRAGYTEDGWFLVVDKAVTDTEITADTVVSTYGDHGIFLKRSIAPASVSVSEDVTKDYDGKEVVLTATMDEYTGLVYSYQWYKDGAALEGETGKTLTLKGSVSDTGVYTVKVTVTNAEDSGVVTENESVTAEASVNVTVNKIENHLTFNYNGSDDKDSTLDTLESTITLGADKEGTRKGYTFIGWNTEADGSGDSYKTGDEFSFADNGNGGVSVTLYAQWKANEYTLNFKIAKDSTLKEEIKLSHTSKTVTYGEPVGEFPWAYRKDYVLVWYDEAGKRVSPETVYLVDGDSTYTAVWYEYIPPVQTGDSSNIALYAAAMFASLACIGAGIILLRRKKEN